MGETLVPVVCATCGKSFGKPIGEYNRRIKKGSKNFYCCAKCAGKGVNKNRKAKEISIICPVCGREFKSTTKLRAAKFCSRSCASKGSVTEKRREAGRLACEKSRQVLNPIKTLQHLLKKREQWKYVDIELYLKSVGENYEFEYLLGNFVYDLILFDRGLVIEFDGPDHKSLDESKKELVLTQNNLRLLRVPVKPNTVISVSDFLEVLNMEEK